MFTGYSWADPSVKSRTAKNLQEAYAAESARIEKYKRYADIASKEGHVQIAKLLRGASEAQKNQRKYHADALEELKIEHSTIPRHSARVGV